MADDEVTVRLPRTEALALATIAETGLKVTEALGLIPRTATAEAGLTKLRAAISGGQFEAPAPRPRRR